MFIIIIFAFVIILTIYYIDMIFKFVSPDGFRYKYLLGIFPFYYWFCPIKIISKSVVKPKTTNAKTRVKPKAVPKPKIEKSK